MYHELLWIFTQLPDHYLTLDTETTGLPDDSGLPDIVTIGITVVNNRKIAGSLEFNTRPQKRISAEAQSIHGITNEQAGGFDAFDAHWSQLADYLKGQLIVIHNASFDWPIVKDHVQRYDLPMPEVQGIFCSQKAAMPWAQAMNLPCGRRGPSLDTLAKVLGVADLRARDDGLHGARIDSQVAFEVAEALRKHGLGCYSPPE